MTGGRMARRMFHAAGVLALLFVVTGCIPHPAFVKGQEYIQAQRWEDAVRELRKAVAEEPENAQYRQALELAETKASEFRYRRGQELLAAKPLTVARLRAAMAEFEAARGYKATPQVVRALEGAQAQLQEIARQADALPEEAASAFRRGDWAAVGASLARLKEVHPGHPRLGEVEALARKAEEAQRLVGQAQAHIQRGGFPEAIRILEGILKESPEYREGQALLARAKEAHRLASIERHLRLARLFVKEKKWAEAVKDLLMLFRLDAENEEGKKLYAVARPERVRELVAQATTHHAQRRYLEAVRLLRSARDLEPQNTEVRGLLQRSLEAEADIHYRLARGHAAKKMWGNAVVEVERVADFVKNYREREALAERYRYELEQASALKVALVRFGDRTRKGGVGNQVSEHLLIAMNEASQKAKVQMFPAVVTDTRGFTPQEIARYVAEKTGARTVVLGQVNSLQTDQEVESNAGARHYTAAHVVRQNAAYWDARFAQMAAARGGGGCEGAVGAIAAAAAAAAAHGIGPDRVDEVKAEYVYSVLTYKKISKMSLTAFLYDSPSGLMLQQFVKNRTIRAQDDHVKAYPPAGVAEDPLILPSDAKMEEQIYDLVIREMVREALPFRDLHQYYVAVAEHHQKRRETDLAVESYMMASRIAPERGSRQVVARLRGYSDTAPSMYAELLAERP